MGREKTNENGRKESPAGPHDKPELTDEKKTPGSGMLPDRDDKNVEAPSG